MPHGDKHRMRVGLQWLTGWWSGGGVRKESQPLRATFWSLRPHSIEPERRSLTPAFWANTPEQRQWWRMNANKLWLMHSQLHICTHQHTCAHTHGQIYTQTPVLKPHQCELVKEQILEIKFRLQIKHDICCKCTITRQLWRQVVIKIFPKLIITTQIVTNSWLACLLSVYTNYCHTWKLVCGIGQ